MPTTSPTFLADSNVESSSRNMFYDNWWILIILLLLGILILIIYKRQKRHKTRRTVVTYISDNIEIPNPVYIISNRTCPYTTEIELTNNDRIVINDTYSNASNRHLNNALYESIEPLYKGTYNDTNQHIYNNLHSSSRLRSVGAIANTVYNSVQLNSDRDSGSDSDSSSGTDYGPVENYRTNNYDSSDSYESLDCDYNDPRYFNVVQNENEINIYDVPLPNKTQ
jgi:hypothetical protein